MQRLLTRLRYRTVPLVIPSSTRHVHLVKPFLGLSHLSKLRTQNIEPSPKPSPLMSDSDTEARHINKKPRLDLDTPEVASPKQQENSAHAVEEPIEVVEETISIADRDREAGLGDEAEIAADEDDARMNIAEDAALFEGAKKVQIEKLTETEAQPPPLSVPPSDTAAEPQTGDAQSLFGALTSVITNKVGGAMVKKAEYKRRGRAPEPYSKEDIIWKEVARLVGKEVATKAVQERTQWDAPFERQTELELTVSSLSAFGDSLALAPEPYPPWVVITPFALPGETIRAKVYRHSRLCSYADLIEIVKPNPEYRDMSRVQCKYFGECSGCQYQMLSYEKQLELKRDVIVKAYELYSDLPPESIPTIPHTIGSPLQYGYRTKITPHFEYPIKRARASGITPGVAPDWFTIGFNKIGTRHPIDIEECPIATPTLNEGLGPLRHSIIQKLHKYKKGASLLLRESIAEPGSSQDGSPTEEPSEEKKTCITDFNATVRERVGDKIFTYGASTFFQNNNSVLVPLTSYVRDAIFPPDSPSDSRPTHLVDAYCGSGLFAITLAPAFQNIVGIEVSAESIESARHNATLNNCADKCTFIAGDAADIFATVHDFPRARTVLVIDPPRKGSDEKFVDQMIQFGCGTVVYVSCNVHTQARDVGMILRKSEAALAGKGQKYVVESLRGFDLFPQTAHVESVAVLRLVSTTSASSLSSQPPPPSSSSS